MNRKAYKLYSTITFEKLIIADSYDDAMEEVDELITLIDSATLYHKHKWSSRLIDEDASELILKEKKNG
ncbi:MAG: hypothetical protein CMJ25_07745 [Phycisphaerae bacterium]|nr:hypothetical protein [Phycisphaerae bacterium]